MPTNPQASAMLLLLVSQTKANLDMLVSQNYLMASDVAGILSQLSSIQADSDHSPPSPILPVSERTRQMSLLDRENRIPERAPSPPKAVMPIRRIVPPPPAPATRSPQAKALWDYNVDGSDPNDLSFHSGDVIEIISETNPDWWTGKLKGRQGLFPSNYVERLPDVRDTPTSPGQSPIPVPAPMGTPYNHPSPLNDYRAPPPFPSGPSSYSAPPPSWNGPPQPYNSYNEKQQQVYAPPPAPVQAPPEPEKKKSKFGGLGTTMANSAAGGVGFGAGAAIGSGIINSIF